MLSVLCMHLFASTGMSDVQVQGSPGYPVLYSGPLDCVRKIAATEGLRGFYRCSPHATLTASRSGPALRCGDAACYHTCAGMQLIAGGSLA